jgi:hypothetical protein
VVIHWREMKLFAVGFSFETTIFEVCAQNNSNAAEESWPQDSSEVGIRRAQADVYCATDSDLMSRCRSSLKRRACQ